ncbi:MAG: DUF3168 domain-containing protein [Hyphomicrobiaceae bacterium]|nr:DUF3168 domain-containing protein [Hyphomicrobiaceae bacterium]
MASAGFALQRAIFERLSADGQLTALIGPSRIYDDVPREAEFPYVTFGQTMLSEYSTGEAEGYEHVVTLHVWSRANGRRQTHEVMAAVRAALHDASLTLTGYRLVNLRHELSEARRDPDGDTYHGLVRFRAVTEPLG